MNFYVAGTLYHLTARLYRTRLKLVFSGIKCETGECVAIKIGWNGSPDSSNDNGDGDGDDDNSQEGGYHTGNSEDERIYQRLEDVEGTPRLHAIETQEEYHVLVADLLGPTLADLLIFRQGRKAGQALPLNWVLVIADRMLRILKDIHHRGIVHGDVKPSNIAFGRRASERNRFYLFDFDVASLLPSIERTDGFIGTLVYSSIRAHLGCSPSPCDDLESLLYTLIFLAKSRLPWFEAKGEEDLSDIKERVTIEELCQDLPAAFADCFRYIRGLTATTDAVTAPDHDYRIKLFQDCFESQRYHRGKKEVESIINASLSLKPRPSRVSSRIGERAVMRPNAQLRKRGRPSERRD